ncbi:nitroreductase/quinone reductase family protein [Mycolicibacterium goodii]|uniref:DUF385 domain-containing protein n=1 Tax=Mycolicibacterium goodii TaxID=134601 RepID=A0A0K0XGS1_MYCGD|nr:hypothetical protein AFA91_23495 [Mycolicibacterium goodii]
MNDLMFVRAVNGAFSRLTRVPVVGSLVRRGVIVIRYTGRRSGQTFETPVGYRKMSDRVVIRVEMPDRKTWWRNFLGEGGPITLVGLDGADRTGHAVAHRDDAGKVSVTVQFDAT